MISTSAQYKSDMEEIIRLTTDFNITFKVIDPDAEANADISNVDEMYFSDASEIMNEPLASQDYLTMETDRWLTDGKSKMPPYGASVYSKQGSVKDILSESDGTFGTSTVLLTANFATGKYTFFGLTLLFDPYRGVTPNAITIKGYEDTVLMYTYPFDDIVDGTTRFDANMEDVNKVEVIFDEMKDEGIRARLAYIGFGIILTYDTRTAFSPAMGISHKRSVDPTGALLPEYLMNFKINNADGFFNPDSPTGIFGFIVERQPIEYKWIANLSDGTTEEIAGGNLVTSGEIISTKKDVTIYSQDLILYMDDMYKEGVYSASGTDLSTLADDVLTKANLFKADDGSDRWSIDSSLESIYSKAPLPKVTQRELLQMIAVVGRSVLYSDVAGDIIIETISTTQNDYYLDFDNQISEEPLLNKKTPLKSVIVQSFDYVVDTASSELATYDFDGATTILLEYPMATTITGAVSAGTIVSSTYYAEYCEVEVTGTGTLTVTGYKIETVKTPVEYSANDEGKTCNYENPLITDVTTALAVATFLASWYNKRNEYQNKYRGRVDLEPLDLIYAETTYSENAESRVVSNEISVSSSGMKASAKWRLV